MLLSGGLAQTVLHAEPGGEPMVDTRYEARRHRSIVVPIAGRVPSGILHLNTQRLTRYHTTRLAALGYAVTLTKCAA
jgi:hypothetical protein